MYAIKFEVWQSFAVHAVLINCSYSLLRNIFAIGQPQFDVANMWTPCYFGSLCSPPHCPCNFLPLSVGPCSMYLSYVHHFASLHLYLTTKLFLNIARNCWICWVKSIVISWEPVSSLHACQCLACLELSINSREELNICIPVWCQLIAPNDKDPPSHGREVCLQGIAKWYCKYQLG